MHGLHDPVDSRVATDGCVLWVHQNDLEEFVGGILVDPVGVENSKIGTSTPDTLFGGSFKRSLILKLVDALVCGFS